MASASTACLVANNFFAKKCAASSLHYDVHYRAARPARSSTSPCRRARWARNEGSIPPKTGSGPFDRRVRCPQTVQNEVLASSAHGINSLHNYAAYASSTH